MLTIVLVFGFIGMRDLFAFLLIKWGQSGGYNNEVGGKW